MSANKTFLGRRMMDFTSYPAFQPYSRVTLWVDDNNCYTSGDDTGRTLEADCPWATQEICDDVLARVNGYQYVPYTATDAMLDPSAEIGDGVTANGRYSVLASIEPAFDSMFTATVEAPADEELDHEFPYKSSATRAFDRKLAQTRAAITVKADEIMAQVEDELNGLSSSIDIKLDSITSTVQGLDGDISKLEQTATSLQSQITSANGNISTLQQTATSLQSQITSANGNISSLQQTDNSLQSQITSANGSISTLDQKIDSINLSVSNGTNSSTISLTVDGFTVATKTIKFTGTFIVASDLTDGTTTISGDNILTGEISAEYLKLGGTMSVYADLDDRYAAGSLGYVSGRISGNGFTGIGMIASNDTAVLGSAQDDVLILSVDDTGIFAGNNIDLHADNYVRIFGDYLIPRYDESTYCGSYSFWWLDGYFKSLHVDGSTITSSDSRLKENIDYDISKWMTMFDALKPCSYKLVKGKRTHVGMIAQEVIEAGETAGLDMEHLTAVCEDKESGMYGLRYEEFVPILIAKVQQLEKRLEALSA